MRWLAMMLVVGLAMVACGGEETASGLRTGDAGGGELVAGSGGEAGTAGEGGTVGQGGGGEGGELLPGECRTYHDCPQMPDGTNRLCVDGECVEPECVGHDDCLDGWFCDGGLCIVPECWTDWDCPADNGGNRTCKVNTGTCVRSPLCRTNLDCADEEACGAPTDNVCVCAPDTSVPAPATGVCLFRRYQCEPCQEDYECRTCPITEQDPEGDDCPWLTVGTPENPRQLVAAECVDLGREGKRCLSRVGGCGPGTRPDEDPLSWTYGLCVPVTTCEDVLDRNR